MTWEQVIRFVGLRKRSYQLTFGTGPGRAVLTDLARFCRANETCFDPDPRIHAAAEGRREVYLRIVQNLNLTDEELATIYTGSVITPQGEQK